MNFENFNQQEKQQLSEILFTCCGSARWVDLVLKQFPYSSEKAFIEKITAAWYDECGEQDWLESFQHHPKIGDIKSLSEKFSGTAHLAGEEQSGVNKASQEAIAELSLLNTLYENKFGFIFIVSAKGKSATEMLRLLNDRLQNTYREELSIAMGEQHKITQSRIRNTVSKGDWDALPGSQLTTHVLDTSIGRPGREITIRLQKGMESGWSTIAQGLTNNDGRITDLLPPGRILPAATYKIVFDTGSYFQSRQIEEFYPSVEIVFNISDDQHYHVPLLINPFGYSTYRGS